MKKIVALASLTGFLSAGAAFADVTLDGSFTYIARQTVPTSELLESDNDLARFMIGAQWSALDGAMRGALEFGALNEDFESSSNVYGGELLFGRRVGNQRYSIGGRVRSADKLATTGEAAYVFQNFGNSIDFRGLAGVQGLSDTTDVYGRSQSSLYGLGELTWFAGDSFAIDVGLLGDSDGAVGAIGAEWKPRGWFASLFLEWGHAVTDDYRDVPKYNDLAGGIRIVPRSKSLKSNRRGSLQRVLHRYVEVQ